jgi:hypothetical protein
MSNSDDEENHQQEGFETIYNPFRNHHHNNSDGEEGEEGEEEGEQNERRERDYRNHSRSTSPSRLMDNLSFRSRSRSPGPVQQRRVYPNSTLGLANAGARFTGVNIGGSGSGAIGEKPPDPYVRINKEQINWNRVYEPEHTDNPDWNFLGTLGQSIAQRRANPDFVNCHKIWEENYDLVTPIQNATLVQNHYNNVIREVNKTLPVWTKKAIYTHFEIDNPTRGVTNQFWLRTLHGIAQTIVSNQLYRLHVESGIEEVDLKFVKPLLSIRKQLSSLQNECSRINPMY